MAADNMAVSIEVDPPDDLSHVEYDVEAGISSSRSHLIQSFEEERPQSVSTVLQNSIHKTVRKTCYYCSFVTSPIKKLLFNFKLLIIISIYTFFGAWLFTTLEVPTDLSAKEEAYHGRLIARDVMVLKLRAIYYNNKEDREERWKDSILQFERDLGLSEPTLETDWTFWMGFLYAGTLYSTIGYGNIACETTGGKVATLIYAFLGLPIMIMLLNDLGNFLLKWVTRIANGTADAFLYLSVHFGMTSLEQGSDKRLRYISFSKKLKKHGIKTAISVSTVDQLSNKEGANEDDDEEPDSDPPVFSALLASFGWVFFAAAIFSYWEEWSYFTSVYFLLISFSTIGLGDVVPSDRPEYMISACGIIIVGLALISACINVVQLKIERMYAALLKQLLKEYMEAVEKGDPNAASGMMTGFKGRAKLLMPLMSKSKGAMVMNQFKEDCVAHGIDPPPVLTNIDPSTGMPAFAKANKEEFKEYIEHAEEKRSEEKKVEVERLLTKNPQIAETISNISVPKPVQVCHATTTTIKVQLRDSSTQAFFDPMVSNSPVTPEVLTFGTQTVVPHWVVEDHSFSAQFSPECSDSEIQTTDVESTDEGIQTWPSSEDISSQYDAVSYKDSYAQYDFVEPTTNTTTDAVVQLVTTGVQPDVCGLYFCQDDSDSEISLFVASEDDSELEHHDEELEGEKFSDLLTVKVPLLEKSVSVDSQDTVIHVSPVGSPETSRKLALAKKKEEKERKRREREKRREARQLAKELRFMKNSGNQTCYEVVEFGVQASTAATAESSCQYEINYVDSSTQDFVPKKARRSQTKLTCITKDNLVTLLEKSYRRRERRTSSERLESTSSALVSAVLPSIDEVSDIPSTESSVSENPIPVEEVNLNLSLVARPVNEEGQLVDSDDLEDDVFESDDEIQHDELELFSVTSSTQTHFEATTTDTQTELTTLRLASDIEDAEIGEQVRFLTESCVQTATASCDAATETPQPAQTITLSGSSQTDAVIEPSLAETMSQTIIEQGTSTTQTAIEVRDVEVESKPLMENIVTQTSIDTSTSGTETETQTEDTTPNLAELETQTDDLSVSTSEIVTQTEENPVTHCEMQTEQQLKETVTEDLETQTTLNNIEDLETQTEPHVEVLSEEFASQTEEVDEPQIPTEESFSQTEEVLTPTQVSEVQTDSCSNIDSDTQTIEIVKTTETAEIQTDKVVIPQSELSTQTVISTEELETQTEIDNQNTVVQTAGSSMESSGVQTVREEATDETQTEDCSTAELEVQTENPVNHQEIQTTSDESKSVMQTEAPELSESGAQTEILLVEVLETQTDTVQVEVIETQTSPRWLEQKRIQTEDLEKEENGCQTEMEEEIELDTQETQTTDELATGAQTEHTDTVCQTECELVNAELLRRQESPPIGRNLSEKFRLQTVQVGREYTDMSVSATTPYCNSQAQSDVSMFVVKQKDRSRLEVEHNVRFNVDSGTWMEEKRMKTMATQYDSVYSDTETAAIQCQPEMTTSHTQHQFACLSDSAAQTDVYTKNKRSQDDNLTNVAVQTDGDMTDSSVDGQDGLPEPPSSTGMLWSDFDPIVLGDENEESVELEDEEEKSDVEVESESSDVEIDETIQEELPETLETLPVTKPETKPVIKPEMEDCEVQAVPVMDTTGSGMDGAEDWVKVYVAELDQERKQRMLDIGIQTGVLARVQHMYGRTETSLSESEPGPSEVPRVSMRKTDSTEALSTMSSKQRLFEGSQESLARTSSVMSIAESVEETSPAVSKSVSRASSFKKPKRKRDRDPYPNRDATVAALRSRFEERKEPDEERTRSSSTER